MTTTPTSAGTSTGTTTGTTTIGVFDSGFGGLTVLRALIARLPQAHYAFLGDTARLPYGSKSRRTIARYAAQSA
ncbi:MAG: glutamate racemase, partial [Rhodoferax sp.]|nr:glutamate racemase [Rhodoferax sp.]